MRVSLNQIKQFIDFELPPVDELVSRINQQLGGVEEVIDLNSKYKGAVVVRVISCEKHPDADRLNVTKIDDGGVVTDVERDEDGFVQVVCGAPNVHADMFAIWLPPGSTVPASIDEGAPFVLDARKLRGVMSYGMLSAADELAIGSDHEGIIEVTDEDLFGDEVVRPGLGFAKAFGLDDTIIDIENKMFTHRPDLFGQLGVAREIAGIFGHKFNSPSWYTNTPVFNSTDQLELTVFNEASEKVPRVMFTTMSGVEVKSSPLWLQTALVAMGSKPINNIVDMTNYVMLITAQPTHAYDYDKIRGHAIGARMAVSGEKVILLNGKEYELADSDIVIADSKGPIGLGGIMGGQDSEVSLDTKNIILEVATFNMYAVRKSSMRHGIFTDALTRFNKGQSPLQNDRIIQLLLSNIADITTAKQASDVLDEQSSSKSLDAVKTTSNFVNNRLGLRLEDAEIAALLENVELGVSRDEGVLEVLPSFWRTDVELQEDVVEEVGRLYGFDKLPRELPWRRASPTPINVVVATKRQLRHSLARYGANEVLSYSFVHGRIMQNAGQNLEQAYQIKNALSPDLQYYRLSVLPSLLDKVHPNIKSGHDEFALFEIGKYHDKKSIPVGEDGIPEEGMSCDVVYASKESGEGAPYYRIKQLVDDVLSDLGISLRFESTDENTLDIKDSRTSVFEPKRLAKVYDTQSDMFLGYVGEFKKSVQKPFKLPEYCAGASIDIKNLTTSIRDGLGGYTPLSKYPSVERDVTLAVSHEVEYASVMNTVSSSHQDEDVSIRITPVSIYSPENSDKKNITLHVSLVSYSETLDSEKANSIVQRIIDSAVDTLDAEMV